MREEGEGLEELAEDNHMSLYPSSTLSSDSCLRLLSERRLWPGTESA